jgi:[ribosomal protein S18]-alanine N-acetyltransferase
MISPPSSTFHVDLEPMERRHVSEVVRIEQACFPSHWPESAFHNELANRCARYLVAKSDGRCIGFAGMWVIMDEAHITTLGVLPEFRRNKIGERLLVGLLEIARSLGARRATLEVRTSNEAAIRLYEKYGFVTAALRRKYYPDTGEDALVMWVNDLWSPDFEMTFDSHRRALEAWPHRRDAERAENPRRGNP